MNDDERAKYWGRIMGGDASMHLKPGDVFTISGTYAGKAILLKREPDERLVSPSVATYLEQWFQMGDA